MRDPNPLEPAVAVRNLRREYRRAVAVEDVSFVAAPGEVLGILGPNGAGKTTTVETIAGLRAPTSGSVRVRGLDPRRDRAAVRRVLGVQLQNARFHDSLTVDELIALHRSFHRDPRPADEVLEMVDLHAKRRTRFERLSGGQQQRLAVGIALVGRPEIVILDELTTGLDPTARRRVWQAIESLTGVTILLVSHAMDEIERLCDRVVLLDRGRVRAEGTPDLLKARTGAPSLEEAFVALTGRRPDEDAEDER